MDDLLTETAIEFSDMGAADASQIAQSIAAGVLSTASDVMQQVTGKKTEAPEIKVSAGVDWKPLIPIALGGALLVMLLKRK